MKKKKLYQKWVSQSAYIIPKYFRIFSQLILGAGSKELKVKTELEFKIKFDKFMCGP